MKSGFFYSVFRVFYFWVFRFRLGMVRIVFDGVFIICRRGFSRFSRCILFLGIACRRVVLVFFFGSR